MFSFPVFLPFKSSGRGGSLSTPHTLSDNQIPSSSIYPCCPAMFELSENSRPNVACSNRPFSDKLQQYGVTFYPEVIPTAPGLFGMDKVDPCVRNERFYPKKKDVITKKKPMELVPKNTLPTPTDTSELQAKTKSTKWQRRLNYAGCVFDNVVVKVVNRTVYIRGILKKQLHCDDIHGRFIEQRLELPAHVNADRVSCRLISKSKLLLEAPMIDEESEKRGTVGHSGNMLPLRKEVCESPSNSTIFSELNNNSGCNKGNYRKKQAPICHKQDKSCSFSRQSRPIIPQNRNNFANTENDKTVINSKADPDSAETSDTFENKVKDIVSDEQQSDKDSYFKVDGGDITNEKNVKDRAYIVEEPDFEDCTRGISPISSNSDYPSVLDTKLAKASEHMLEFETSKNVQREASVSKTELTYKTTNDHAVENTSDGNSIIQKADTVARCRETDTLKEFELKLEIPDCRPETITAKMDESRGLLNFQALKVEGHRGAQPGSFMHKAISLPETIDTHKISCTFKDGILSITAPYKCGCTEAIS